MIDPTRYATVTGAAKQAGVKRPTLVSAIARGELSIAITADGLRLVELVDVARWAADTTRRRGPKTRRPLRSEADLDGLVELVRRS